MRRGLDFFSTMIVERLGSYALAAGNFLLCLFYVFLEADFKSEKSAQKRGPIQLDQEAISCAMSPSPI
jgi:hypothetical protein